VEVLEAVRLAQVGVEELQNELQTELPRKEALDPAETELVVEEIQATDVRIEILVHPSDRRSDEEQPALYPRVALLEVRADLSEDRFEASVAVSLDLRPVRVEQSCRQPFTIPTHLRQVVEEDHHQRREDLVLPLAVAILLEAQAIDSEDSEEEALDLFVPEEFDLWLRPKTIEPNLPLSRLRSLISIILLR